VDLESLAGAPRRTLERLFCAGSCPDADGLVGWEFHGFSPWLPARAVRFQRFVKGFFRGAGSVEGYNLFCSQRDWRRRGNRHGFYVVQPASGRRDGALVFDYRASERNRRLNPERLFRDFVVQPDPDNPDLLLGKAYLKVGPAVPTSFFVLERDRPVA
jgi:hypothetical protein